MPEATKVMITRTKLDSLADEICTKAQTQPPLTIDQMITAVRNIETGSTIVAQEKTVYPSASIQIITPDTGYNSLSKVTINPVTSETITIISNGTYSPAAGSFFSEVTVNIEDSKINLQSKTVTPTTMQQSVVPDTGFHALSTVVVNKIPSNYADVTSTTATINDVKSGKTFIDSNGSPKTGLLTVSSYYVGSTDPDSSLGNDGDLYLKV